MRPTAFGRLLLLLTMQVLLVGAGAGAAQAGLPVVLDGEPALVAAVGAQLARRGVKTGAGADVEAIRVSLASREGAGIVVALRDRYGRGAERVVATEATAATLIESWTWGEYAEAPPPPVTPPAPVTAIRAAAPVPANPTPLLFSLRLTGETVSDGERSQWLAATPGLCGRVGPTCFGVEARFARRIDDDGEPFGRWRDDQEPAFDLQGLLTAELAIALGRPSLLLGFGAGVGRRSEEGRSNVSVRSEARVGVIVPIWSELAFDAGLVATLAPAGEARRWAVESEGLFRFGLGLRWGLR